MLANGSQSTVNDVDANGIDGVEQCLRQDSFVGREAGDARVFFACPVNHGGNDGGGEGLEECGHGRQHFGPVPCVDVAGAAALGDGGVGEQRAVVVLSDVLAECVDEPLKREGTVGIRPVWVGSLAHPVGVGKVGEVDEEVGHVSAALV